MNEKYFQKKLAEKLKTEQLYNLISEESIEKARKDLSELKAKKDIKVFSINEILKHKYLETVEMIINILRNELTVILDSGHDNISLDKCNSLNPDFVLFDLDSHSYIIVELKVSVSAERQAVTEILGYQLEIKNYLPGISNYNIPLIIISNDFRPLLLHSVAGALMQNIPILCLTPVDDGANMFTVVDCNVWTQINYETINKKLFSGYTFCLYPSKAATYTDKDMKKFQMIASDLIYNRAVVSGSQGMTIAWKYREADGIREDDFYLANYFISIFYLNPFSIFGWVGEKSQTDLGSHIEKVFRENRIVHMGDGFYTEDFINYLSQYFNVRREGFIELEDFMYDRHMIEREIVGCESWGEFGNIIRNNYINNVITFTENDDFLPGYKQPVNFLKLLCLSCNDFLTFENLFDYFRYGSETAYFKESLNDGSYRYIKYMVSKDWYNKTHSLGITKEKKRLFDIGYMDGIYYEFTEIDSIDVNRFFQSNLASLCCEGIEKYLELLENGEVEKTKHITGFLLNYFENIEEYELDRRIEGITINEIYSILNKATQNSLIYIYLTLAEELINYGYFKIEGDG
ncbi:hypothetical protein [Tepidibacter aestuarii]|uniref:hypothetical protein n=1 Tax=Tepidibacter aestuarii TaxID=2925782 RepID=UPI0020BEA7D7|nr:hypothetical protein [Tepidibacter aestuarii]CAH2213875.1 protein of unknown function [Tepidibacter aestuarii]